MGDKHICALFVRQVGRVNTQDCISNIPFVLQPNDVLFADDSRMADSFLFGLSKVGAIL